MTHERPDDWSDLAEVWTTPNGGVEPTAELVRGIRRRAWLARVNFQLEAWGAVLAGVAGGWIAFRHDEPLLGAAAFVFAVFALAVTLWARRGAEPGEADTPAAALRTAIGQARSGLRWARAGQATTVAALLFVVVVAVDEGIAGKAWLYVPAGMFLTACSILYERHTWRCRRRIADHEAALAELDPPA
ncbi:hypothetical protein [Brevundimonas lenta]|uniref:Uncharacterized protein n=1 Tax=Brevundimonas lenta TaxID=424796 RepID=A0A7W6NPW0_9CAUL|nr:hypothetical protein [Brevundimonas lenta]MBB4083283.1 hypothetical protein [Brevundimonas lenta]